MALDDDLLELTVDRRAALEALAAGAHHRRELQQELSVSKTTCHRIIRTFDDHGLVTRTDSGYALSTYGAVVAEHASTFANEVELASRLRPLFDQFDAFDGPVDSSVFTDPMVDWIVEDTGTFSIDRGVDRIRDTEILRVLDWTPVPDLYYEKILSILAENQAHVESIYPESEVADRLERFPALHDELLDAGARPRYWVFEEVPPWGLSIYDDSLVEVRAYEQQSAGYILEAVSESEEAVAWALDVFEDYRDRANAVTELEGLPDWGDYTW